MRLRWRVSLVAVGLCVAALLSGCSSHASGASCSSGLNDHTNDSYCGLGLDPPQPRPQFTMTDTTGKKVRFADLTHGKPTLLFFGYTTCPDVCPTTMADIAIALGEVSASIRSAVQVVFVSTDPKTDTLPVIQAWLNHFDPSLPNKFIGLRGTVDQVNAAEAGAHVTTSSEDGKTHSAEVVLYGADDYARVAFLQSDDESADIAHDLGKVVK